MKRLLGPYSDFLYGLMRVILAFLYGCHGLQKLFGMFGGHRVPIHSLLGRPAIIEVIGGTLIAVGPVYFFHRVHLQRRNGLRLFLGT